MNEVHISTAKGLHNPLIPFDPARSSLVLYDKSKRNWGPTPRPLSYTWINFPKVRGKCEYISYPGMTGHLRRASR